MESSQCSIIHPGGAVDNSYDCSGSLYPDCCVFPEDVTPCESYSDAWCAPTDQVCLNPKFSLDDWDLDSCRPFGVCCLDSTDCVSPKFCISSGENCSDYDASPSSGQGCDAGEKCCKPLNADADNVPLPKLPYEGPKIDNIDELLGPLTRILYYGGLFIGISFLVYAGYKLMVSQGNPRETQEAQEQLTAAILGIVFILLSAAILRIIINTIFQSDINI
jgi:hypothetical protein